MVRTRGGEEFLNRQGGVKEGKGKKGGTSIRMKGREREKKTTALTEEKNPLRRQKLERGTKRKRQ